MDRKKVIEMMHTSKDTRRAQKLAILADYEAGMTPNELARKYDYSYGGIYQVLRKMAYKPRFFKPRSKEVKTLIDTTREEKISKAEENIRAALEILQSI